jgi:4a-hydroxytetrahydrobiopterin dehydratase
MARLSDEEIEERRSELDAWERDGDAIRRTFELEDFKGSVDFVNRLTPEAEEMNHHPDPEISWNKVTVSRAGSRRTTSSWPAGSTDWPEPMLLSASSADERRRRSSK